MILSVARKLRRSLVVLDADEISRDPFSCCLKAAVAKCLDFNDVVHSKRRIDKAEHLFVSGMRGICEDLIVLRFLAQVGAAERTEFLIALMQKNTADGVVAQSKFFRANNSLQPVIGGDLSEADADIQKAQAKASVQGAARAMGYTRVPTVAYMARTVGLTATYEFIYFLTSNFVHFNPQALMRMGWGRLDKKDGRSRLVDVKFSGTHMRGYYRNLGKFYGTILLIGFVHLIRSMVEFNAIRVDKELSLIEKAIAALERWPEAVTFEEMNVRPPLFFIFRAIREVMKSEGESVNYGQILDELKFGTTVQPVVG